MTIANNRWQRCFVLGGARSGKSSLAERYAQKCGLPVTYIATAEAKDEEMAARITHHQKQRPVHWQLVEAPTELAQAITRHSAENNCILIDCLTLWLTNLLCQEIDIEDAKARLIGAITGAPGKIILVSNEVGHGIVPMGELSRSFIDQAGWLHQEVAKCCDRVDFIMAGLPLTLKAQPLPSTVVKQESQR